MAIALAGALTVAVGCQAAAPAVPASVAGGCCPKGRVHVFAVNGLDPLCVGKFDGLCACLRDAGYENTHFHRLCNSHGIAGRIAAVRRCDPSARIVLVGFSAGCFAVRSIANALGEDGTQVDLLVYLAGDLIRDVPSSRPCNVGRVLCIRANGLVLAGGNVLFNRDDLTGARNARLECGHFQLASQPVTLELILEELAALSSCP